MHVGKLGRREAFDRGTADAEHEGHIGDGDQRRRKSACAVLGWGADALPLGLPTDVIDDFDGRLTVSRLPPRAYPQRPRWLLLGGASEPHLGVVPQQHAEPLRPRVLLGRPSPFLRRLVIEPDIAHADLVRLHLHLHLGCAAATWTRYTGDLIVLSGAAVDLSDALAPMFKGCGVVLRDFVGLRHARTTSARAPRSTAAPGTHHAAKDLNRMGRVDRPPARLVVPA